MRVHTHKNTPHALGTHTPLSLSLSLSPSLPLHPPSSSNHEVLFFSPRAFYIYRFTVLFVRFLFGETILRQTAHYLTPFVCKTAITYFLDGTEQRRKNTQLKQAYPEALSLYLFVLFNDLRRTVGRGSGLVFFSRRLG